MFFADRVTLGKTFARNAQKLSGQDAVVVCLKEESLLTCLTLAMQLRAWIYPLLYVPIHSDDASRQLLGAYYETGLFCQNPDMHTLNDDDNQTIAHKQPAAQDKLQRLMSAYEMNLYRHVMNGRDIILVGDVLTSTLPLAVAKAVLSDITPKSLTILVGNAIPAVADQVRLLSGQTIVLDVLNGPISEDNRYFERPDTYTLSQKQTITKHIATYWQ